MQVNCCCCCSRRCIVARSTFQFNFRFTFFSMFCPQFTNIKSNNKKKVKHIMNLVDFAGKYKHCIQRPHDRDQGNAHRTQGKMWKILVECNVCRNDSIKVVHEINR